MLFGYVSSLRKEITIPARLLQVLIATPQHIAQLVVSHGYSCQVFETQGVKHLQEKLLYLRPKAIRHVLKVGVFGKPSEVFLRCSPYVPAVIGRHSGNTLANVILRIAIHVIKEVVKVVAKQLAQAMVRHGFMQQGLLYVRHVRVVRYHDGYPACLLVEETLGSTSVTTQGRSVCNHVYVL